MRPVANLATMGQHLHLYASHHVPIDDVYIWCRLELFGQEPNLDHELVAVRNVNSAMQSIRQHLPGDHLEHWASGGGVACFSFLDGGVYRCNHDLIETAITAARSYRSKQQLRDPDSHYARHDWTNDSAIHFLKSHIGYTVWGFNDGI